ncbi:hypothetical protein PDJAM_G00212080 [Pangasius djambal]|uniref:Uncharacterized protein n=1 Tax=Pangasius djambal TaxID=1691987 RepID=A0ACC5YBZ2_9TELE|nr:hypothetical protein [Pangasius djambal]
MHKISKLEVEGSNSRRPHWVPLLSAENRNLRLSWAQTYQNWTVEADSLFSSLGLGAVVGLGMAGLLLLLVLVDISCFFLRQCGLLMCITRKLCSKKTATSGKSKEMEEGKAAYLKLPLKEENGKESLKPDTIEIKVHGDNSLHTTPDDSKA